MISEYALGQLNESLNESQQQWVKNAIIQALKQIAKPVEYDVVQGRVQSILFTALEGEPSRYSKARTKVNNGLKYCFYVLEDEGAILRDKAGTYHKFLLPE